MRPPARDWNAGTILSLTGGILREFSEDGSGYTDNPVTPTGVYEMVSSKYDPDNIIGSAQSALNPSLVLVVREA